MWNIIILLWSCIHIAGVDGAPMTVIGHRGERVDIRCSYKSGYESKSKYFCKGECNIINKNIIIESGSPAKDKRFSLTDDTTARVFTVSITDLRTEDAGQYWCAVRRTLRDDVYSEIRLQVKLAPVAQTPLPQTSPPDTGSIGIIIAGVLVLLLICAVLLVLAVRKKMQSRGVISSFTEEPHLTSRKAEENEYAKENPAFLPNSQSAQSDNISTANVFHRAANAEAADSELDYVNVAAAATNCADLDQIYTELNSSRQSHVYHCLSAHSAAGESIYHNIDQTTD